MMLLLVVVILMIVLAYPSVLLGLRHQARVGGDRLKSLEDRHTKTAVLVVLLLGVLASITVWASVL